MLSLSFVDMEVFSAWSDVKEKTEKVIRNAHAVMDEISNVFEHLHVQMNSLYS